MEFHYGIGIRSRSMTGTSIMRSRTGTRTSEDHDFREFLDEDGQDEGQDGTRTRKGTRTSEDGDFRECFGRGRPRRGPGRRRGRDGDKGEYG